MANPVNAFIAGRAAGQDYQYGQTRNALANLELQNAPGAQQRRNAMFDTQLEREKMGLSADKAKFAYTQLQQAIDSGRPREFVMRQIPDLDANLRRQGVDLSQLDDATANDLIGQLARKYAGEAGIAPEAAPSMTPYQQAQIDLEREKMNAPRTMSPYEQARIDIERQKLNQRPSASQFVSLTPEEIAAAGLPAGTSAQRDSQTGKIEILSKRDNTSTLSQKDATTAKMKLNTVKLARKQLNDIRNAFQGARDEKSGQRSGGIAGTMSAGPGWSGQGIWPSEGGAKFDKAVDMMRSTLTALTRVPGVGAMSDYETKLDQAKFPSRGEYESVTTQNIDALEDMLALIENGYADLLSGGSQPSAESAPSQPQAPPAAGGSPVRVRSVQEARALPPGTVFVTPDGRTKVR